MIDTEVVKSANKKHDLCRTFSTERYKLLQVETREKINSYETVDLIAGYDEQGKPYSRYTYIETEEKDEPIERLHKKRYDSFTGT